MRTVLLTGASSGIGAAAAACLAGRGWRVFGASRRPQSAASNPAGQDGTEGAGRIDPVQMDVRDETSVRDVVASIERDAGALDALVCNAGFGIFGSLEETSLDEARSQFETNVFGVLACLRAVLPAMRRRGRGRIVLVGSLSGRAPIPFQVHYSASKAAVDSIAQGLRMELAPLGIDVALVEPGDIKTAFNDATDFSGSAGSAYDERIRACEDVIRRSLLVAPEPAVVAEAIVRALEDATPRTRYPVGPDSFLVPFGRRLFPERFLHWMIRRHFRV